MDTDALLFTQTKLALCYPVLVPPSGLRARKGTPRGELVIVLRRNRSHFGFFFLPGFPTDAPWEFPRELSSLLGEGASELWAARTGSARA